MPAAGTHATRDRLASRMTRDEKERQSRQQEARTADDRPHERAETKARGDEDDLGRQCQERSARHEQNEEERPRDAEALGECPDRFDVEFDSEPDPRPAAEPEDEGQQDDRRESNGEKSARRR